MFDHVGIVVTNLHASAQLYAHMLGPLGIRIVEKHRVGPGSGWVVMSTGTPHAPFFVIGAGRPSFWRDGDAPAASPMHLSFRAPNRDAVNRFHARGLQHGARDNGAPGIRRAPFHCAFLIDLDGNNIEAGCYLE